MASIKGLAIQARLNYLVAEFGESGLERVVDRLPAEQRESVQQGVLISEWYPLELNEKLLEAAEQLFGSGDGAICRGIGMASARRGLTTVHSVFTDEVEAAGIALQMERTNGLLWKAHYDRGSFSTRALDEHAIESEMEGLPLNGPWICHVLTGYLTAHLEVLGGREVTVEHDECVARQDSRCLWKSTWAA